MVGIVKKLEFSAPKDLTVDYGETHGYNIMQSLASWQWVPGEHWSFWFLCVFQVRGGHHCCLLTLDICDRLASVHSRVW